MKNKIIYLLLFCTCLALPGQAQQFKTFEVGKKTFLLNGEPFIVKAAEQIGRASCRERVSVQV